MRAYAAPSGPLKLEHLTGSYLVRSGLLEDYRNQPGPMLLDVLQQKNPRGTTAAFDMGLLEETMLLSLSTDSLKALRQDMEVSSDDSDLDSDWGDYGSSYGRKRKAKQPSQGQPFKRRLGETPTSNRVYLLWGGREKGGGRSSWTIMDRTIAISVTWTSTL